MVKDSMLVKILPYPIVMAANDTSYCSNQTRLPLLAQAKGYKSVLWQAKNIIGQVTNPNEVTSQFISSASNFNVTGTFVITAFTSQCGFAKDSLNITLTPGLKVSASTHLTCFEDRRVLLTGKALSGNDPTTAEWKSSGTGRFSELPSVLSNTYVPSPQDIEAGSVELTLATNIASKCPPSDTSFTWKIVPLPKLIIPTSPVCEKSVMKLEANKIPGATYFWGNAAGSTSNTASITLGTTPAQLKVLVQDASGCKDSTLLALTPYAYPVFTLQANPICPGEASTITTTLAQPAQANDAAFTFQWKKMDGGNIASTTWEKLHYDQAGTYSLELSFHGCSKTNSVNVLSHPNPNIDMPLEYRYCPESDAPLKLSSPTFDKYFWHFDNGTVENSPSITVSPPKTTRYRLVVINQFGCKDSVKVLVKSICPPRLFVPNVITPYSNDVNSTLQIYGVHYTNFEITIFNRWGEIIFNTKDPKNAWDGVYKLENMPIGTYPWIVTYEGESEEYKGPYKKVGEVTIVR